MKKNKFFFIFLFFLISLLPLSSSEKRINGYELCDDFYNFLEQNDCNPTIQTLVKSNNLYFPFNIEVFFEANKTNNENPSSEGNLSTLVLSFRLEEAYTNKDIIKKLIGIINSSEPKKNCAFK